MRNEGPGTGNFLHERKQIIPLGAALSAASSRVCLVPAELRVSAWCQLGTDASDCLYLALNGRVLRARYMSRHI